MSDQPTAPPVMEAPTPPPVLPPVGAPQPPKPQKPWQRAWAGLLAFIAAFWKYAYFVFKLGKAGKFLLTAGTMLLSVWVYAKIFTWKFAIGFVICIFVHEMGHVFVAWQLGIPVSAPIFIPGFGALIIGKRFGGSAWRDALVGIGGPLFGAFSAVGCYALYSATGNKLFLALAFTAFFMNLFNMTPMFPLDGGWITGAVSPYIWVVGMVILLGLAITGRLHNPFIYLLIILSLPRIVYGFKHGHTNPPGQYTTLGQKLTMGFAYVALCGFLAAGMAISDPSKQAPEPTPLERPGQHPVLA